MWTTQSESRGGEPCFPLLEKEMDRQEPLHSLPVTIFWTQNATLEPRANSFFPNDIAPEGQNGPWKPSFSHQQPLLCLHLNQLWPTFSLILVVPLLISSQPIQSSKGPLSLPCLGCTTIKLERKEFKQRMNRKNDFSPWHIIGFMLITFLFLRKSNSPISLELLTRYKWLPWERVMDGLAAWFTCLQSWHARLTFVW